MISFFKQSHSNIKTISICLTLLLGACAAPSSNGPWQGSSSNTQSAPVDNSSTSAPLAQPVEVALLVPLSGRGSDLGQAILNASQLALFDMAPQGFQIIPRDTKGTPIGAQVAAQEAINNGADLILGPLFSQSVQSAAAAASPYNVQVVGFTTDKNAVSYNSFAMGFLPGTQVNTILEYAIQQGKQSFTVVAPNTPYGKLVTTAAQRKLSQRQLPPPHIHTIQGASLDLNKLQADIQTQGAQAILLATDTKTSSIISNHLLEQGLSNHQVQRLGLGLWDNTKRSYSSALDGAIFAAPSPLQRERFTRMYQNSYGTTPPRLATMGYDSTALAISLAKFGGDFSKPSLTRQNGFYGLDGIFRFHQNGLIERGLAIMEFSNGRTLIRHDSPKGF